MLSEDNYIKKALTDDILKRVESEICKLSLNELRHMYYPPLFLFVSRNDLSTITALNEDILLVKENSSKKSFNNLIDFLKAHKKKKE